MYGVCHFTLEQDIFIELNNLGLLPGVYFYIKEVKIIKIRGFLVLMLVVSGNVKSTEFHPNKDGFLNKPGKPRVCYFCI